MNINLHLTPASFDALCRLDEGYIDEPEYMGLAQFWHTDFNEILLPAKPAQRRRAHRRLQFAKLPLDGTTVDHRRIIEVACKKKSK